MSDGSFTFKLRTQFSFIVDDRTLSCILSGIANQSINLAGHMQTKLFKVENNSGSILDPNCNLVRLVAGAVESENIRDIFGVRGVLHSLGVNFEEKPVIQVFDIIPGTPGVINALFGALWCRVTVNALYLGDDTKIYIDVSDIGEALIILSIPPVEQCPKSCQPGSGVQCGNTLV